MALEDILVYDRTQADVIRLQALAKRLDSVGWNSLTPEEQAEWQRPRKGAYNYGDMNRVGSVVAALAAMYLDIIPHLDEYREARNVADDPLFHVPYTAEDVDVRPKNDWRLNDHVWASQAAQYLRNLVTLRGLMPVPEGTPEVPSDLFGLTYSEANDIERLLDMLFEEYLRRRAELEKWIRDTASAWTYSAEPFCGEV